MKSINYNKMKELKEFILEKRGKIFSDNDEYIKGGFRTLPPTLEECLELLKKFGYPEEAGIVSRYNIPVSFLELCYSNKIVPLVFSVSEKAAKIRRDVFNEKFLVDELNNYISNPKNKAYQGKQKPNQTYKLDYNNTSKSNKNKSLVIRVGSGMNTQASNTEGQERMFADIFNYNDKITDEVLNSFLNYYELPDSFKDSCKHQVDAIKEWLTDSDNFYAVRFERCDIKIENTSWNKLYNAIYNLYQGGVFFKSMDINDKNPADVYLIRKGEINNIIKTINNIKKYNHSELIKLFNDLIGVSLKKGGSKVKVINKTNNFNITDISVIPFNVNISEKEGDLKNPVKRSFDIKVNYRYDGEYIKTNITARTSGYANFTFHGARYKESQEGRCQYIFKTYAGNAIDTNKGYLDKVTYMNSDTINKYITNLSKLNDDCRFNVKDLSKPVTEESFLSNDIDITTKAGWLSKIDILTYLKGLDDNDYKQLIAELSLGARKITRYPAPYLLIY